MRSRTSLKEEDAKQLLGKLIAWLIQATRGGGGSLVRRKLCSTLVVYFLQFPATWTLCVSHLLSCLEAGVNIQIDPTHKPRDVRTLVQDLRPESLQAALWFCTMLAEEVGKTDANNIKQ